MEKNIRHSDDVRDAASDEESYNDFAMRLAKTFNWSSSSRQNTMEFIAVVLGLLLAWSASLHHFTYNLHEDSISSLAWAEADRVNSTLARQANIIFSTISVHLHATVAETVHIPRNT